jgi:tRNA uridine 5-carbamoylmethylation protein Kti12
MIIVEGMDNTGKSTLVQHLAEKFKLCKVATYHKPQSLVMIHDYDFWLSLCPQPLILDRHPAISDLIYGNVLRGISYITERESRAWSKDHLIIYCRPAADIILKSFEDRPQLGGVKENLLKLLLFYDTYMEDIKHVFYDHTNLKGVENAIREYLQSSS